jgi:hypothetical protein
VNTSEEEILKIIRFKISSAYASSMDERLSESAREFWRAHGAELEKLLEDIRRKK